MNRSSFQQRAYLTSYPYNAAKSGHLAEYYKTLTDFDFLQDKINYAGLGVQPLINDYDLIEGLDATPEQVKVLQLIRDTLRLSAHILQEDSTQLPSQLWGRLLRFTKRFPPFEGGTKGGSYPDIETLLKQAKETPTYPRLQLYSPTLTPPDTPLIRTLTGHSNSVNSVVVTPDGKTVISGSYDNTLKVWDLATGKELQTLTGHSDSVNSVVVTPDGKTVISGSSDNTIKVWDLETGKELQTLTGHSSLVNSVVVTPDGKTVISGGYDNTLKVWDLETGKELQTLRDYRFPVNSVVGVTPDGKKVIGRTWDRILKVWDLETGKELQTLTGYSDSVNSVGVIPDGKKIISGSGDNNLNVWDLVQGIQLQTLSNHSFQVYSVGITPDGKTVISGSRDNTLKVWELATGNCIATFIADYPILCCAVASDGVTIIVGDSGGMVHFLNYEL